MSVLALTGRRRHRCGLFGRLVLQVEVRKEIVRSDWRTCEDDRYVVTSWRDARATDMYDPDTGKYAL